MRLSHTLLACSSAIAVSLIGLSASNAASIDQFDCGDKDAGLILEVSLDAAQGKGSLKSARGLFSLRPNGQGAWLDAEQVIQFYPEEGNPRLFMESEQFSCSMMVANNQSTTTPQTSETKTEETAVKESSMDDKPETMAAKPEVVAEPTEAKKPEMEAKPEPLLGKSLGGRVRGGPGTNFDQTGSLQEGDPVEIVTNSGVRFNGYDWFEIRYDEGQSGFQWGGIMCSSGQKVDGIYQAC